jgi:nucleotide-binding universal stress UspA family protein
MKILIYVSSQTNSKLAVMFGSLIARHTQSSVALLTAIDNPQDLDTAHQFLSTARGWAPELDMDISIRVGPVINCVLEEIDSGNYDLIILKACQVVKTKKFLAPKLERRVAQQAPISVLVVKQKEPILNRILICTSGVDISGPVIEMGAWLAHSTQAKVTLLHVTGSIPYKYTGLGKIQEHLPEILQTDTPMARHLRQAVSIFVKEKVDADLELRHGSVSDEILMEARTGNYDLIMLGASKISTKPTGWLMGDITYQVINAARRSILVVRKPRLKEKQRRI